MKSEMDDPLRLAGAVAVDEIAGDILKVIAQRLRAHGPDPNQAAIVSSAIVVTLDRIAEAFPEVRKVVAIQLAKRV